MVVAVGFGGELGQLVDLDGRAHFVRDHCTVDGAFGQRVRHLWHGHAHGRGAQFGQQLGGLAGGAAQLQALDVGHGFDLLLGGEDVAGAVHVHTQHLHVFEFVLGVLFKVIP